MHTVYRIHEIKQIGDSHRLWQVKLTGMRDNDEKLNFLIQYMRKEIFQETSSS
jgi:hypothetical protein